MNFIISKLAKAAGILSKVRHYVSKIILVKLYYKVCIPLSQIRYNSLG